MFNKRSSLAWFYEETFRWGLDRVVNGSIKAHSSSVQSLA